MSSGELRIERCAFRELKIPFTVAFRHAAAARTDTETVWIDAVASDVTIGNGESCPRPYVTGETLATAGEFVARHEAELRRQVNGVGTLRAWVAAHEREIDAAPAAWCALELAMLDLLGKQQGVPV